jgi:class 3 adenylate cyclase
VLTVIVGSVGLWEHDAELMSRAVARHDATIGREVAGAGGTVVRAKGEGDSTFSVFDHPADAVAAAVAIQAAIEAEDWPTVERLEDCPAAPVAVCAGQRGMGVTPGRCR